MDDEAGRRTELTQRFLRTHEELSDVLVAHRLETLSRTHLTAQQLRVLGILQLRGEQSSTELAALLGVSAATVSGLVDRLEATGMVERRPHPTDGRVRMLTATAAGTATLHDLVASEPSAEATVLAELSLEELEHLTLGLAALLRAMHRAH